MGNTPSVKIQVACHIYTNICTNNFYYRTTKFDNNEVASLIKSKTYKQRHDPSPQQQAAF